MCIRDRYNWLRGPFKELLIGGYSNMHAANQTQLWVPSLLHSTGRPDPSVPAGAAVLVVPWCSLRQVKTSVSDMATQKMVAQVNSVAGDARVVRMEYNRSVDRFRKEIQDTSSRGVLPKMNPTDKAFEETSLDNKFVNAWGVELEAWDFDSTWSQISYPGESGQVLSCNTLDQGVWMPVGSGISPTTYSSWFDMDLDAMEKMRWIDATTSMVQISCSVWNPSNNLQAEIFYTTEFFNSGKVSALTPRLVVGRHNEDSGMMISSMMLFGFYLMMEEVQDMILTGFREYAMENGWSNVIDWVLILFTLLSESLHCVYLGLRPSLTGHHHWSEAAAQSLFVSTLGLALFFAIIRFLKYTYNVPIMCQIGRTFTSASYNISLFLATMLVLFVAFGVCFHITLSTDVKSFGSLRYSLFTLFEGLLGNMDGEEILRAQPYFGPVIFVMFYTMVLFVGFTILISIISNAYDTVKDDHPRDGFLVSVGEMMNKIANKVNESDQDQDARVELALVGDPDDEDRLGLIQKDVAALVSQVAELQSLVLALRADPSHVVAEPVESRSEPKVLRTCKEDPLGSEETWFATDGDWG
eukprot:TRINITY_DN1820_c0_g1_i6.p1 TRINITY_DN1820_c0_g1~~TRINITY_DN1820_c0_g1_i6.p1  ORF type:complete len:582 (+),score=130.82 TRINITY_DN1820_c0_g1_i6:125-1870(+)